MLFRKTLIAVLASLGTALCAHAQVLSDSTKLIDLSPGDSVEITKAFDLVSGQGLHSDQYYHPDCDIKATKYPDGSPLKKTLAPGTTLRIKKVSIEPSRFIPIKVNSVLIEFDDPYVDSIECNSNVWFGKTNYMDLTVKDMRRALLWNLWVNGHSGQGSNPQAAAGAKTSEDAAKTTAGQTVVAQQTSAPQTQTTAR